MVRSIASSTLTLPNLIGVGMADLPCVLSADQLVRLGELLLQARPQESRAVCFLGGALSALASSRRGAANLVALDGDLGEDSFLVIAGQQAAVALLAAEAGANFQVRLFTDPDLVDRAALVLSQFGDVPYSLDAMCDPEAQRGFVAATAVALATEPTLRGVDLAALLGDERRWLDLARAVAVAAPAELLGLPALRAMLREAGIVRTTLGLLEADAQQLRVQSAEGGPAPQAFAALPAFLSGVARSQRTGSVTAADTSAFSSELGGWVAGMALTAAPLLHEGRVIGLLLAVSERPLAVAARATLNGLAALCANALAAAPAPSAPATAPRLVPPPRPPLNGTPPAPPPGPGASGSMSALAARLSGARTAPPAAAAPTMPAPTVPAPAPVARAQAPSLAQRVLTMGRGEGASANIGSLLEHLSDGIVLVDGQGRLMGFTRTAMQMLGLQRDCRGKSLVESGALPLATLFVEAITGELVGPREVELPMGSKAAVEVLGMDGGAWAFVLRTDETRPAAREAVAVAQLPAVDEQERSESFLANFSNIIRVPLRELRELITQVPAMGNLNEQQSRLIGQVVRLNSEMTMLVNDLLALGQIRLQTSENRAPMRIDLLVEAAVGTQYAEFGRRGQHVVTEIAPGLPRIHGSEEGLSRAVAALIDNAIKYSPAGAQIKVAVVAEGGEVVVSVQDNGPGLETEALAQVFDPFFRAPSTEGLGVSGRGLGLTIAKAVIEQHGGRIWATSAPGQGCAFSFSIPGE